MKVSKFYNKILREIINKMFSFCQILGLHITPVHFYQPIPDTRRLKETLWTSKSDLTGVEMNERKQIELLSLFKSRFKDEYESFPKDKTSVPHQYYLNNGGFGPKYSSV
ncbi:MAG: hypothetical protein NT094_02795 [Candidatus Staskawiczbacteria bacterium]|nr:hypothetical protein [Candidatus Staskawiczbacteria bacterium]